jgi:sialate O-acetylesterase
MFYYFVMNIYHLPSAVNGKTFFFRLAMRFVAAGLVLLAVSTALAETRLSPLFSDGAVLQRGREVPIWGGADPGESVTVRMNGKEAVGTADGSGRWSVKLPSQDAGGPFDLTVQGKNTIVLHDILVGEVWVASGQSNMNFPLQTFVPADPVYGPPAKEAIAAANDPMLRMFNVKPSVSPDKPADNLELPDGQWKASTPETAGKFSAVAYYFATELRKSLNVPVGIIHSSIGGTPAETWMSQPAIASLPECKPVLEKWEKLIEAYPDATKTYQEKTLPEWKAAAEKAKAESLPPPRRMYPPMGPNHFARPSTLFNGMIAPLIPYGIQGVIWYQGEANSGGNLLACNPVVYRTLFPALIKDWRTSWGQGDFPFLFVQLANLRALQTKPVETAGLGKIREAQMMALSVPNTGMATAIDLADMENPDDIHPHNKKEVGRRLSLIALAKVYQQKIPSYSGPLFSGFKVEGSQVRLNFTHVDGGLTAEGDKLEGFAIAGKDGRYVWGNAKIDGETVLVSSDLVSEPANIRYGWAFNPIGNLRNKAGLPALPFRTDTEAAK